MKIKFLSIFPGSVVYRIIDILVKNCKKNLKKRCPTLQTTLLTHQNLMRHSLFKLFSCCPYFWERFSSEFFLKRCFIILAAYFTPPLHQTSDTWRYFRKSFYFLQHSDLVVLNQNMVVAYKELAILTYKEFKH